MTNLSSSPVSPLLREAERVSPATSLDLVVGYDADGFPVYCGFAVGTKFSTPKGLGYKVIGFSLDNHVFAVPYGLGHEAAVRFVEFGSVEGVEILPEPITSSEVI